MRYEEPAHEIEEAEESEDDTHQALLARRSCGLVGHALHLSCHQGDIQHSLSQTNEGKQPCDGEEEDFNDLIGRVEIDYLRIELPHAFVSPTVNGAPDSYVFSLEFPDETVEFGNSHISRSLQVDVHGHYRKFLKKFLKKEQLIPLRLDDSASSEGLIFLSHVGQFIRIQLIDQLVHSACPLQISVMMHHQLPILGHAYVQFEHVTHSTR